jgi:hypothetical protein
VSGRRSFGWSFFRAAIFGIRGAFLVARNSRPKGPSRFKARCDPSIAHLSFKRIADRLLLAIVSSSRAGDGTHLSDSSERRQTLADLPVTTQPAVSSAIGPDRAAHHAPSSAAGVNVVNPAKSFSVQIRAGTLSAPCGRIPGMYQRTGAGLQLGDAGGLRRCHEDESPRRGKGESFV